ncbi:MAG: NAD(P)H-hydrate epimerase, partial [Candidatus Altiarchaeota archaeon]
MDSQAIDANARYLGVPTLLLMENAGRAIADECAQYKKIAVFSGCGGNGGDGLAAARILHARGHKIKAYALAGARTRECQKNFDILSNLDVSITQIRDSTQCENIKKEVSGCDAVVDALLGVGASGVVREPAKSVIGLINSLSCPKISVDVPSGSGDVKVEADTILALHSGKVAGSKIVDIGIPPEAELYCGPGDVYSAMPPRKVSSRKGDFGRVLVLGGSKDYVGTPTLVAKAALKAGADLVFVSAPAYACDHMAFDSNLIVRPLKSRNHFSEDDVDGLLELDFDV